MSGSPGWTAQGLVDVHLLALPVPLWAAAQEHTDELLREFALIVTGLQVEGEHAPVPTRLLRLVEALRERYSASSDEQQAQLFAAAEAGQEVIDDLTYRLPAAVADAARELEAMLDEADEYCRAGEHLLTLATPPELVRFRRWYLQQVASQVEGAEPVPWPDYRDASATG